MGKRLEDFTGMTFGNWRVGEYVGENKYKCTCVNCGYSRDIAGYFLKNEKYPKCICMNGGRSSKGRIDLTGKAFGEWTVLEYVGDKKWLCQCSCGRQQIIAGSDLRNGKTTKCRYTHTNGAENKFRGMKDFQELTAGATSLYGKTFGELEVLYYVGNGLWRCKCSCGNIKDIAAHSLTTGATKSCGHATTGLKDIIGQEFDNWRVLERLNSRGDYLCRCKCGNLGIVSGYALRSGKSKSCGCLRAELARETLLEKYGVESASRVNYNLTREQMLFLDSPNSMKDLVRKIKAKYGMCTIPDLARETEIASATLASSLRKHGMLELMHVGGGNTSTFERELDAMFPGAIKNDRKALSGVEIDLYYPSRKLGIEFNGKYWHSELHKERMYHVNKTLTAFRNGIHLINVFEYEWEDADTRRKLIEYIKGKLNNKAKVVYARDCSIVSVEAGVAREFLERNHLQGYAAAEVYLGLKYNNELVGLMTFGKPRFNRECEYELIRLAWKSEIAVVGGSEKLFRHFIENYSPDSIVSYCDMSKFTGEVYSKLGFKLDGITDPGYVWCNGTGQVLKRYDTQKGKLIKAGIASENESEAEAMHRLGYYRVYDCGNMRCIWRK